MAFGMHISRLGFAVAALWPLGAMAQTEIVGSAAAVVRHVEGIQGQETRRIKIDDRVFF